MTITKLRGAEYLIQSVAVGIEDYFMGVGEAPGVWHGKWAAELGLEGVVEAGPLRALVEGQDPSTGTMLLARNKPRVVKAYDLTLSAPKSVSLLWAFGGNQIAAEVSIAVSEATTAAMDFIERHAAVTRKQTNGVRRRVDTHGFAVALFSHRTSRDGDPQLHTHCLIPNIVERADGRFVAVDANPMHVWLKASGTVFQSELQRLLTDRLGVVWGPERNGCRDLIGFTAEQRRAFSKRTTAIETVLEAGPEAVLSKKERMRADERASLKTRRRKDRTLTPERLRERWEQEAAEAGIPGPGRVERSICHQTTPAVTLDRDQVFATLVDPDVGLCATEARFNEAHVVERIAALARGRLTVGEIEALAVEFIASDLVVRLAPTGEPTHRRPPEWSTVEHRAVEDAVLAHLDALQQRSDRGIDGPAVFDAVDRASVPLGDDQERAVDVLCAPGAALRVVLAPAGHGKTALTATATHAATTAGRPVVALATTNKAVAELRAVGVDAHTIVRFRLDGAQLQPNTVVVLDEVSQVSTRDADTILQAVVSTTGAMLWCLGDADQGRSVRPGGLAVELHRLADGEQIPSAALVVNRRQQDPAERRALRTYRAGGLERSQTLRNEQGWEHEHATAGETRDALADAAIADTDRHGVANVVVLAVSHADCEDIADRIRTQRRARGELSGLALEGPGWGSEPRVYAAGDRVLLHANLDVPGGYRLPNGTTGTVLLVRPSGLVTRFDGAGEAMIPTNFVQGVRPDGSPGLSHGWARTIDGAQGGSWEQVHLLATPTLDRNTAYVGQSRGRRPTHTWNTVRELDYDHGNVVADNRTPSERTLAAMSRTPPRSFAAYDDPFVIERRLLAERTEHQQALAAGPPAVTHQLADASHRQERGERLCRSAWDTLNRREQHVIDTGGVRQLRPANRRAHHHAVQARDAAAGELADLQAQLRTDRATVQRLELAALNRERWVAANAWRHDEITELDQKLADHWATTVRTALQQGDPLAFGLNRLREARTTMAAHTRDEPEIRGDLDLFDHTLAELRRQRIAAYAQGERPPAHVTCRLGPVPPERSGRDVWCGLAELIEEQADRGIEQNTAAERLDRGLRRVVQGCSIDPLDNPERIIAAARSLPDLDYQNGLLPDVTRWQLALQRATQHLELEQQRQRALSVDRGHGLSL